jgi:hypothetical protein
VIPGAYGTRNVVSGVYAYGTEPGYAKRGGRRPLKVQPEAVDRLLRVAWLRPPKVPALPRVRVHEMAI